MTTWKPASLENGSGRPSTTTTGGSYETPIQDHQQDQGTAEEEGAREEEAAPDGTYPGDARMNSTQFRRIMDAVCSISETAEKMAKMQSKLDERESWAEELAQRMSAMEVQADAMREVVSTLLNRGKGRPSKADTERLEEAQARMNGSIN